MSEVPGGYLLHHSHHGSSTGGHGGGSGQPPGQQSNKPTYSKRGKITIVACVPCRRRKTKCDGRRPTCSQCASRDGVCSYDMNEEQRRLTFLRENVEQLAEEKSALEAILWNLKTTTNSEASEILRRIRSGADYSSLVQQIQASRSLTEVKGDYDFSSAFPSYRDRGDNWLPPISATIASLLSPAFDSSSLPSYNSSFLNIVLCADTTSRTEQAWIYERLIKAIVSGSSADSDYIVHRLRRKEPIDKILDAVSTKDTAQSSEGAMEIDPVEPSHSQTSVRPMAGNALAPLLRGKNSPTPGSGRAPDAHTPPRPHSQTGDFRWTTVTEDREFLQHLLDIYFMWQHTFFQNFPEHLFKHDFLHGQTKWCSRVLVNAICAAACLLSDRPEARGDSNDPTTVGAGFFEEGMRLLNLNDRSSIPTTAGVFILSHVEGYRGRLGAMWGLVGRSARMSMDLHLHLRNDKVSPDVNGTEEQQEEAGRVHGFWGCFVSDQVTSLTLGRLPQLLTNAITVELPPVGGSEDEEPWGPKNLPVSKRPGARATTFRHCASLSKIVNSTLIMFFAPSQIIKGSLILDEYEKYLQWNRHLPPAISSTENAPAHVLSLHIYYHSAVLLLFRPFLRAKFTASSLSPSELCRSAATSIAELFATHLQLYGSTGIYTFQIQCLLAACTIHLINLPAIAAATALTKAADHFHQLINSNTWALRSIKLIRDLVRKWGIILPREVEVALYRAREGDFRPEVWASSMDDLAVPRAEFGGMTESESVSGAASVASASEAKSPGSGPSGSKRGAFLNPSSQPEVLQKRQRLAPVQRRRLSTRTSSDDDDDDDEEEEESTVEKPGEKAQILFAPFPNQPAPLLGPIHTSSEADPSWNEEVKLVTRDFDGLKFEGDDGWFDPFMGI